MAPTKKQFLKDNLVSLGSQVGGQAAVSKLPVNTIIKAAAFFDDVLAITIEAWAIDLVDMDIDIGYEVYNKDFELQYAADSSSGLVETAWGTLVDDITILWNLEFGQYIYLCYRVEDGSDRTLMLIKF